MELGLPELFLVLVVVLLFAGPGKLTRLGHDLGKGIHDFREAISGKQADSPPKEHPDN